MQLAIHPLILLACFVAFAAVIAGILFILRFFSGSFSSTTPKVLFWYFTGLLVYGGSLYAGTWLNPHDQVHGSWTDPYLQVATAVSFLVCVVMPFRLPIPLFAQLPVTLANLFILAAAFWLWFSVTA